jgi:hypothetical protein
MLYAVQSYIKPKYAGAYRAGGPPQAVQNKKASKKPDIALVQLKTINSRLYLNSLSYVLELLKKQLKNHNFLDMWSGAYINQIFCRITFGCN